MRKIKVLHVQLTDNFGGIESLLLNVFRKINHDAFEFDFIATAKAPYQNELKQLGAHVYIMPDIKEIFKYKKSFRKVLTNDYDIIHFHKNSAANIIPILWAKKYSPKSKIIVHSHNSAPSINNKLLVLLHKINRHFVSKNADEKLACSKLAAKWMFKSLDKATVIYNGIDLSRFSYSLIMCKKIRQYYKLPSNTLVVGNVGRFSEQKNHSFLIDIFYQLLKRKPNAVLFLIGAGPLKAKLIQKTIKLGIKDKVYFLGNKVNVQDYLSAMDIYIAPSLYEGLSVSLIEAQAEGLPLFLSNRISDETIVTDLVKKFSLSSSAYQIATTVLKNYPQLNDRSKYSTLLQVSPFNINKTVKNIENLYQRIV